MLSLSQPLSRPLPSDIWASSIRYLGLLQPVPGHSPFIHGLTPVLERWPSEETLCLQWNQTFPSWGLPCPPWTLQCGTLVLGSHQSLSLVLHRL